MKQMRSLKKQGGWLSAALAIGGAVLDYSGKRSQGKRNAAAGRRQAAFDKIAAGQRIAIGQHEALEETRQAELVASRAVAVAAAGGASQDITNLLADIDGEGVYRASLAMHEAETEAEKIKFYGAQAEQTGRDKQKAYNNAGIGSLLSGARSAMKGGAFNLTG